ncbi:MAG TPA: aldehyde dehydrogenase family protein [Pseudonocardia sp.]|jgi:acyl-CoA reductase-like NAD-dependent aldehyde dehydrogenase
MTTCARDHIYFDGQWRRPGGSDSIAVDAAATGRVIADIPVATPDDVDAAVRSARAAFQDWASTPLERRLLLLAGLREKLSSRADELAALISTEVGTPIRVSEAVQVGLPLRTLASLPSLIEAVPVEEQVGESIVWREPIGVVAAITAWNYPLQQVLGKVGAALATGCTVVLKPSEVAPLSAFLVAEMVDEVGFPAGVFNLVSGPGAVVGEPLVAHPDVDMITLTGSTAAGRRIGEVAARTVKRTTLELGGKSANVLLEDADLERAVKVGVANCFTNSGQTCTALTRMLVPADALAEVEELVAARLRGYHLGDPLDRATSMGPLATAAQRDRVVGYIRTGLAEGTTLLHGGPEPPEDLAEEVAGGYFVRPTAFSRVRPDSVIATDEIFGPVLSLIPYRSEDEAVAIANNSIYGLAGAVWSRDLDHATRVARRLRTGAVDINGSYFNPLAPFGGYKQSGVGRELGTYGVNEFYELKAVRLPGGAS